MAEVTEDTVGMLFRIVHGVGHAGLLPARVSLLMAGPATFGTHEMRSRGRWLLGALPIGILQSVGIPLRKRTHGANEEACKEAERERLRESHQQLFSAWFSLNAIGSEIEGSETKGFCRSYMDYDVPGRSRVTWKGRLTTCRNYAAVRL